MSYDLLVFVPRAAAAPELAALVRHGGLMTEEVGPSFVVLRGARRAVSFTVDGPDRVESEDVPPEVEARVLGTAFLYTISVPGSSSAEAPHAVRFARRLARALDGALVDPQTGVVWSRSRARAVPAPERETRVALVGLDWYCLRDDLRGSAAELFIATTTKLLPEARPRRFGEYEPLQGVLAECGEAGFVEAWQDATSMLYLAGSRPCTGGFLDAGPSDMFPGKFWRASLSFFADPLHDPRWRAAVRRLFVELADGFPAVFASAQVTRGHIWSGRSLWADGKTEWGMTAVNAQGWVGLPARPTWWMWFGAPFEDEVGGLPPDRVTGTERGVLLEAAERPASWAELEPLDRWMPADVLGPPGRHPARVVRARRVPPQLA